MFLLVSCEPVDTAYDEKHAPFKRGLKHFTVHYWETIHPPQERRCIIMFRCGLPVFNGQLIHAYWKHPIETKLPISTLKPATFDAGYARRGEQRRLRHADLPPPSAIDSQSDQGRDLCAQRSVFVPSPFLSASRFSPSSVLTPSSPNTRKAPPRVDSPPVLAAQSRSRRPLSVVEVAWQQFSPSRLFGEDGDTSAWGSHAP